MSIDGGGDRRARPLKGNVPFRVRLAEVRRRLGDAGDVDDPVAVEVGDGQGRRDEGLDAGSLRSQGRDRAGGEGEVPVPLWVGEALENGDPVAGHAFRSCLDAEVGDDRVEDAVAGHVSHPDPARVVAGRRERGPPAQGQVAGSVVAEYRHAAGVLLVPIGHHEVRPGIAVDVRDACEGDVRAPGRFLDPVNPPSALPYRRMIEVPAPLA